MAMAANHAVPGLQVTAPEEDMEISDYERTADDIDIDIDISVEPVREEDDYMVDDRSEHENKDDMMLDGDGQEDEDGMMQDNFSVPDEHLTDASEIGYVDIEVKEAPHEPADTEVRDEDQVDDFIDYDDNVALEQKEEPQPLKTQSEPAPVSTQDAFESISNVPGAEKRDASPQQAVENKPASPQAAPQHPGETELQSSHISEDPGREQSDKGVENFDAAAVSVAGLASDPLVRATQESNSNEHHSEAAAVAPEDAPGEQEVPEKHSDPEQPQHQPADSKPEPEPSSETNQAENPAEDVDNVVTSSHEKQDVENQPMSTQPLHPVVVVYNDDEISLFPPSDGDTSGSYYFLQDEDLAHGSIRSLLEACRQVLGETVQHEDELEIDVAELGLRVTEESLDAAQCSFSQVLDAYVQLQRNDGIESPGPLYVALNTRTKFSARLESIVKAVADGKGMSQLTFPEYTAEEPYSDSPDHHEQQPGSHPEETEQAHRNDDAANASAHSPASGRQDEVPDGSVDQGQVATPGPSAESAGVDSEASSADVKPEGDFGTASLDYQYQSYETGEGHYAEEELPEYESEDEKPTQVVADSEVVATEDSSAAPLNEHGAFEDTHKGDDGESHGSSTVRGDNTPATTEGGNLAVPHVPEPASQHSKDIDSSVEYDHAQEFAENADVADQAQNTVEEFGDFKEHDIHAGEDGYPGEENEENDDGEEAQEFNESGHIGEEYEQAEEHDSNQQHETGLSSHEEHFDLPSDEEHDGYDPSSLYRNDTADEDHVQENDDLNEATFADQDVGEYVVVEEEDAHEYTAENHDLAINDDDGHSPLHGKQSNDPYADQTVENNAGATLAELGDDVQRTADDQDHPDTTSAGGVDDDTIDYDDEELSRNSEEPSTAEGVAASPSSFKRNWEEFDHGEETANNDQGKFYPWIMKGIPC
ncbi:uncharacterized protein BKA78DRAFT_353558 [Phyllosticta capitalensis]|uniref:uncharacterized protein n=1 Tax=Phyllosticta capitalensis TaxID=121624 RepID=UPI00312D0986